MDKFLAHTTMAPSLFCLDTNLSQIFKKQQRQILHKQIQLPPAYVTYQLDGITLPQRATFKDTYKVLFPSLLPFKTKETMFQILNRTICMQNKAHKSGMISDLDVFAVMRWRLWNISSMVVNTFQLRFGPFSSGQ